MRRVNIYAECYTASFKKSRRAIGYVIEAVDIEGNTVGTTEGWSVEETTWNEGILMAFIKALSRMTRPCELHLYTQNKVILDLIDNNLYTWTKNGFKNSKGDKVRNAQLWESFARESEGHEVLPEEGLHPYYHWMQDKLKRQISA